jgi:hypothetical protein
MAQYGKELSNLSYTNKDFNAVYSELLDLVPKISYKWDPSVSDESDPGVVLLKLAALMTDKLNYNIDKNILELFPLSVTQLNNARQIFEQCGYNMKYYQGAEVDVSLSLIKEPEITETSAEQLHITDMSKLDKVGYERLYHIPKFTMVSDSENNYVYTLTQDVTLTSRGETAQVRAIQGVATEYTINGEKLITSENLDYNRRLYFTESDIAENGIFIKNKLFDYNWTAVDNLMIQPLGTACYKFGLSPDGNTCYVEFPTDIDSLIGDGLEITYLRTMGFDGNIGKKFLMQFFVDPSVNRTMATGNALLGAGSESVKLSNTNVYITNVFATTNGKNPETIEEAYLKYERVKNTFNTLVSLNDYTDYIISSGMVSNGFACDRTNDIQSTHQVLSVISGGTKKDTFVESSKTPATYQSAKDPDTSVEVIIDAPALSAFDLKLYGLQYTPTPQTPAGYQESFLPVELTFLNEVNNTVYVESSRKDVSKTVAFNNVKCIQHDFKRTELDKIIMLKNKYPIIARIIPQYKVTAIQEADIIAKVISALQKELNSQRIAFGEDISYDSIYDTIINADPRIKAIILENINYETYAVYLTANGDERVFNEIRIDSESNPPYEYSEVTGSLISGTTYYIFDTLSGEYVETTHTSRQSGVKYYVRNASQPKVDLWHKFRAEIYAKSVLAGTTQMYEDANQFIYSLKQKDFTVLDNVASVTTNADIPMYEAGVSTFNTVTVDANENILFTSPNLVREGQYSTYIKRFYFLYGTIHKDEDYQLTGDEWIAFFWKKSEDETEPYYYKKYSAKSNANIVCPTFSIVPDEQLKGETGTATYTYTTNEQSYIGTLPDGEHSCDGYYINTSTKEMVWSSDEGKRVEVTTEYENLDLTTYIKGFSGSLYALTGSNQIETKEINKIHINNEKNGTRSVFWILNDIKINPNDKSRYCELFNDSSKTEVIDGKTKYVYTLKAGEYFMYANASKTSLNILGQGTKLETDTLGSWSCPEILYEDLMSYGIPYITENNYWYTIPEGVNVHATEMQFHQLGPGTEVLISSKSTPTTTGLTLSSTPTKVVGHTIGYKTEGATEFTYLPEKNTEELAWEVSTMLNINCDKTDLQYVKDTHTIDLMDADGNKIGDTITNCCIVSSDAIELTGGEGVDAQKYDYITGQSSPVSMASFTVDGIDSQVSFPSIELAKEIIIPEGSDGSVDTNFACSLPVGNYILKVQNSKELESLTISLFLGEEPTDENSTPLKSLVDPDNRAYNMGGIHYLSLVITDKTDCKIRVQAKAKDTSYLPISVQLMSPYKYSLEKYIKNNTQLYDDVMIDLAKWDNSIFDYTYKVPEDDLIKNPLEAGKFMDKNHIYNKYTIGMWNVSDTISVTNKIK